jgi:geranylgeranyl diphosphate synthase type II
VTSAFDLKSWLEQRRAEVDEALDRALPPEGTPPALIHRAMRYAVFAGGKRLRPILVLAGCEAAGGSADRAVDFACASELVHTYSLVHDDLPALDNDDLRRGRPTVHKAFDEATAVLTGDALLTQAFEVALGKPARPGPSRAGSEGGIDGRRVEALRILAGAIGTAGMIGGQVDDLLATGGPVDADRVRSIHERKTGALLRACPLIGGLLAGAPARALDALASYGSDLGLAFQIVDDILDIEGTPESLGKSVGKDVAAGKATFPAAIGIERSRALAEELAARARESLALLGPPAAPLTALAAYVVRRRR